MSARTLRVLTISDLFPDPSHPALGVFVAHQVRQLQRSTEQVVVVPLRVFPHLRFWREVSSARGVMQAWRSWRAELAQIPARSTFHGSPLLYVRYTSPPRQLAQATWGFFAYPRLLPNLWRLHREQPFDLMHAHYAMPAGVIALLARAWMRVPVVLSIHGADVTHAVRQGPLSKSIVRWVLRNVDAVLVNSEWTARRAEHLGADPSKLRVVHLGAEPPSPPPTAAGRRPQGPVRLLCVAYLEQRKGHAVLLEALSVLRKLGYQFQCQIVGDGPCRAALVAQTASLGLEAWVSFEGLQPQAAVWQYLADCDMFVLPSWEEAFGLVYIEALSMAKPVIGCEGQGGPDDLKALGDCIELVQARDVDSLASALRRLIDDPARRRELGETGRALVQKHYNWRINAQQTLELYRQVLRRDRRAGES